MPRPFTVRALAAAVTAAAITASPVAALAQPAPAEIPLSILATTDVHGHAVDWDYFTDAPYPDGKELGLTHVSSVFKEVRAAKGEDNVFAFDNGDNIQGSPLTSYFANQENILETGGTHPMAKANNFLDYDAQVTGNHEFNYGLDFLNAYKEQVQFPVIAANVIDDSTGEPYFEPYVMIDREVDGQQVKVGVLGLTPPGSAVWDKQRLEGKVHFDDIVTTAQKWAPRMKAEGADIIVALSHSGKDPDGLAWDPAAKTDDLSTSVAREVADIDVVVAGHSHQNEPQEIVTQTDGTKAIVTQPVHWAGSVSEVQLSLVQGQDGLEVSWADGAQPAVVPHLAGDYAEDQELKDLLATEHSMTVKHVNTKIATAAQTMSGATSAWEDTPIVDLIQHVQTHYVREGLKGTEYENLPVISQASPFSRTAVFNEGDVTVRDVAGLYVYDNTLGAVKINGAQLREYLEWSARYYKQVEEGAEIKGEDVTNAFDETRGREIPDYSYDAISGVKYDVNIAKPVGERIENLRLSDGTPLADDMEFALAINNYRQSGGSGYPVADLPEIYNEQLGIREAIVDWAIAEGTIDPADFYEESWWLVSETRAAAEDPTAEPTDEPSNEPSEAPSEVPTDQPTPAPTAAEPGAGEQPGDEDKNKEQGQDEAADKKDTGALPRTGANFGIALGVGAGLLALGGVLLARSRRS